MSSNDQEANVIECRICHSKTTRDLILSPCMCKGSLAYVHHLCLERWLNFSSRNSCELCSFQFNVVMNRRYSCLESVAVWIRNPSNRAFIICDLIIGLVLTMFTLILALFCVVGLNHFIKEAYSQGIEILWSEGFINIFVVMLLIGYIATIYSLAKDHIRPWYHWWTHCNNVKLILDRSTAVNLSPIEPNTSSMSNENLQNSFKQILTVNKNIASVVEERKLCCESNSNFNEVFQQPAIKSVVEDWNCRNMEEIDQSNSSRDDNSLVLPNTNKLQTHLET
ncbi:E3 ubiquitin-protein ligase MARCHF3-like isoform X2 [Homalodisca vitripennis]|uniref:E3 ubiquitin-protein ligase MARCHF3-like isoform X2 n=1 Tax=Homalodisca vitripennis TaxID=197043 RepID=UPI001EEB6263|nr:E3 ubiquitin-protein ligase MARCHF3-like isoform X2 [Homalodisca vitripennis]